MRWQLWCDMRGHDPVKAFKIYLNVVYEVVDWGFLK
jgi:hypothetical protein